MFTSKDGFEASTTRQSVDSIVLPGNKTEWVDDIGVTVNGACHFFLRPRQRALWSFAGGPT